MSYTIPSDSHVVGNTGHTTDHNNIVDVITGQGAVYNVLNTTYSGGADPTGAADSTAAFNAALATGKPITVPAGTYLFNTSTVLSFAANGQQIQGAGEGATILSLGSSFSGAELFSCAGYNDCGVTSLTIQSSTGAWSTAPAANGIEVAHSQRFRIRDVRGYALNGYLVEIVSDATGDSYYPVLDHVTASFCASGAHLLGTASTDHLIAAYLVNCTFEECENGDGLRCEDVIDVTCVNLECSPAATPSGGGTPGVSLHIKGDCASHFYTNIDVGGLVSSAPAANPTILIESSGSGSPYGIQITTGIAEFGTPGIKVTAGSQIKLNGVQIADNASYGLQTTGSAGLVTLNDCLFAGNNYNGGAGGYDLYWNSSGQCLCQNSTFTTASGTAASEVAQAISIQSGSGTTTFQQNKFSGAGAFGSGGGFPSLARNNSGYNPVGYISSPPAVPGSGTAQSNFEGADMTVMVTANSGSTCAVNIGSHTVATIPASGVLAVPLAYSLAITLTYTGTAPTWAWYGS